MADAGDTGRLEGSRPGEELAAPTASATPRERGRARATDPDGLHIEASEHATLVSLVGEADISNNDRLTRALLAAIDSASGDVYLNVVELDFIDVAGVGVLIEAARMLGDRRLYVLGPSHTLRLILHVFEDVLPTNLVAMGELPAESGPRPHGGRGERRSDRLDSAS